MASVMVFFGLVAYGVGWWKILASSYDSVAGWFALAAFGALAFAGALPFALGLVR